MRPEAGYRVYWTKVSTDTKVRIGQVVKEWRELHVTPLQNREIANTIVQLQRRAAA